MKLFLKKYLPYIIGAVAGAVAGYLYWRFVGCNSGTCPITSSPLNSTIYGSVMGILIGSILKRDKSAQTSKPKN
ncbi:MAG: DUF6132 family protein [Rikenellaceae bacterium]|nr:DUF6132 family protein [Rikenellaceae bacterium]